MEDDMKSFKKAFIFIIALAVIQFMFAVDPVIGSADSAAKLNHPGPVVSTNEIFGWINDLCAMGYRRPGSAGELKAEQYIFDKFTEFGLQDVIFEPIPIQTWDPTRWILTINGGNIPCFYIPFSPFTSSSGITGELVYLKDGTENDYEGKDLTNKIVLADIHFGFEYLGVNLTGPTPWLITNWDAYKRAKTHNAAGFIGILKDYFDSNTYYAPVDNYGTKPIAERNLTGLWVSRSDGARIIKLLESSESVTANITLNGTRSTVSTSNIVGFLPGKTDEIIMIHSHHDAAFYGAVEDASGIAEVLALAKYFGKIPPSKREKTIMFLSATGHFYDYIGNRTFVEKHKYDLIPKIVVDICIEHVAKKYNNEDGKIVYSGKNETGYIFSTGSLLSTMVRYAAWNNNLQYSTWIIPVPFGLDFFDTDAKNYYDEGIPTVSYVTMPLYLYDIIDTPDKVAKDLLKPIAETFIDIVKTIDKTPSWLLK